MEKWCRMEYPVEFMETVIAWYEMHSMVRIHAEDAVQKKQERDAKRLSKKR